MLRHVLLAIAVIFAAMTLGYGGHAPCDKTSPTAGAERSHAPLDGEDAVVLPGGAIPFDDDDFTGFEAGAFDREPSTAAAAHPRETCVSVNPGDSRIGPASGHALLHERPPRHARG